MSYCTNCGSPTSDAKFCASCGAAVAGVGAAANDETRIVPTVEDLEVGGTTVPPPPVIPMAAVGPPEGKPPSSGPSKTLLAIAVVGLAVLLAGVIGYLFSSGRSTPTDAGATTSPTPTTTKASPKPPSTPTPPPTATVTTVAPQPTVTVTQAPPDNNAGGGGDTGDGKDCGSSVTAVGPTSCPFALSVSAAYYNSGGASYLPSVYSPVTGQTYDMYCNRSVYPVRCEGGNDAVVLIR